MNAINAYATGVIYPFNDENITDADTNKIFQHRISEYNDITSFYTIPISVPKSSNKGKKEKAFSEWPKKLNEAINEKVNALIKITSYENGKYKKINELMSSRELSEYRNHGLKVW